VSKPVPGTVAAVKTDKGVRNVVVAKVGKFNADVDFNHPLAGRTLYYEIEVVSVREASAEEIAHRHVHGPGGHHH
jgi:FKBP-type peptidyl-prolyl cis-trans isomerase SlyD